jgi:hypothetical protein
MGMIKLWRLIEYFISFVVYKKQKFAFKNTF